MEMREERDSRFKVHGSKLKKFCTPFLLASLALLFWSVVATGNAWKQATDVRTWSFPRDHGSHPEYRTEWWYFTGNLSDETGRKYGYQLTFFRQGIVHGKAKPGNPWSIRDVFLAHFAITDVAKGRFWYAERTSRMGPGFAYAGRDRMDVRTLAWTAGMNGNKIRLSARDNNMEIRLELTPEKSVVLHGQKGLSRKGSKEGQSSYYYSFTRLNTRGYIRIPLETKPIEVGGTSWFDQEFGSNQLSPEQVGWDWFGIHLSDGKDLMLYLLRRKDGSIEGASSGTIIEKDGTARHLGHRDFELTVLDRWKSPRSGGSYPSRWRIEIPSAQVDFLVSPNVADQELVTEASTGITYWEGSVSGKGTSKGRAVTVEGYAELTGYAGSLGGVF